MIKSQSISVFPLSTCLLIGLAAILCNGCATDGVGKQAAYDRKIQRTEQLLIAAGDADSLAAAAMFVIGPTVPNKRRQHPLLENLKGEAPIGATTRTDRERSLVDSFGPRSRG